MFTGLFFNAFVKSRSVLTSSGCLEELVRLLAPERFEWCANNNKYYVILIFGTVDGRRPQFYEFEGQNVLNNR